MTRIISIHGLILVISLLILTVPIYTSITNEKYELETITITKFNSENIEDMSKYDDPGKMVKLMKGNLIQKGYCIKSWYQNTLYENYCYQNLISLLKDLIVQFNNTIIITDSNNWILNPIIIKNNSKEYKLRLENKSPTLEINNYTYIFSNLSNIRLFFEIINEFQEQKSLKH